MGWVARVPTRWQPTEGSGSCIVRRWSWCRCGSRLEFGVFGSTGEGNDVADVLHTGHKEQQAFKTQAETGVWASAIATGVEVPQHIFHGDVEFLDACHEFFVVLFTHGAADDFANLREKHVGALHRFAVGVLLHVESLDFLGVVNHNDRFLEVFFHQIAFVFAGEVDTPIDWEFKLLSVFDGFFEYADTFGVGKTHKVGGDDTLEAFDEARVDHLIEESQVIGTVVESPFDAEFDKFFFESGEVFNVVEGYFGFHHPEFGQVAWSVAVCGAERGAEGVYAAQSGGAKFAFELAANGKAGLLAEEVLFVVDAAVFFAGRVVEVEGAHLEHIAGTVTVGTCDERSVEIVETFLVEESVNGISHVVAHAAHSAKGVGAEAQVANLAQKFHAVAFLLQGVCVGVGFAVEENVSGLNFHRLSGAHRLHQFTVYREAGARGDAAKEVFVEMSEVDNDLDIVDGRTVVEGNEGNVFVAAFGAHPSFYVDGGINEVLHFSVQEASYFYSFIHLCVWVLNVMTTREERGALCLGVGLFLFLSVFIEFVVAGKFGDIFLLVATANHEY